MTMRRDCPAAVFVKPGDNVARVSNDLRECGEYVELCQVFGGWVMLVKPERVQEYQRYCDTRRFKTLDELLEYLASQAKKAGAKKT